jgi:hypothetical protein
MNIFIAATCMRRENSCVLFSFDCRRADSTLCESQLCARRRRNGAPRGRPQGFGHFSLYLPAVACTPAVSFSIFISHVLCVFADAEVEGELEFDGEEYEDEED